MIHFLILASAVGLSVAQDGREPTERRPETIAIPPIEVRTPAAYEPPADSPEVPTTDTDTVFDVDPRARLEIKNHAGSIVVEAWDRDQIQLSASHSSRDRIAVQASSSVVRIKSESRGRRWPGSVVDYELTVPRSMPLDLSGVYTDISVRETEGGVSLHTVQGNATVRDCSGDIKLNSVEGEILVERSRGRIEAHSVDEGIFFTDVEGEIFAETIDGDIELRGIRSTNVEARTVDGDIRYDGAIERNGNYRLTSHDGDVVITIPEGTSATLSVATFDGSLEASFPIEITETETGRRFSFVLGGGAAKIELHSFDGNIRLVRPGELE